MRDKWNVRKKGYLKIHIAVNVKTKKILSMKVTDEHVHDSKALPELVEYIIKLDKKITIGKLLVMALMKVMKFLNICQIMESCHVSK